MRRASWGASEVRAPTHTLAPDHNVRSLSVLCTKANFDFMRSRHTFGRRDPTPPRRRRLTRPMPIKHGARTYISESRSSRYTNRIRNGEKVK